MADPYSTATEIHAAIVYNDFTNTAGPQLIDSNGCIHAGVSLMGWSKSMIVCFDPPSCSMGQPPSAIGNTWMHHDQVPAPTFLGYSILWGDPAITRSRAHQYYFFISNLAIRTSDPQLVSNGCVSNVATAISGACIAQSSDNAETFEPFQCVTNNNDFYDGGSMDTGPNGEVYAAWRDVKTSIGVPVNEIHIWKAANETSPFEAPGSMNGIPKPFQGRTMVSHPRIRVDPVTGFLYAMAVESRDIMGVNHRILIISRYEFTGGWGWTFPRDMPFDIFDQQTIMLPPPPNPSDRAIRTGPQFAFDIGAPSIGPAGTPRPDDVRILYTVRTGSGRLAVRGAYCGRDLFNCYDAPEWSSETNGGTEGHQGQQFNPNVRAFPGFMPFYQPVWKTTYMSTEHNPNGKIVGIQHANFAYFGNQRIYVKNQAVPDQTPCTGTSLNPGGYWSDYDGLEIGYITPQDGVQWLKPFPDSTSAACYDISVGTAKPQHTSVVKLQ